MRVVLLNQYYAPAEAPTGRLLADLSEGLARAGHDVRVICSRRDYVRPAIGYPARERLNGVRLTRVRSTGFGRDSRVGRLFDYLTFLGGASLALAVQSRPDVVVSLTTPPMLALLGLVAARLRRARSIYWVMDLYPDLAFELGVLRSRSLPGRLLSALSRWLLRGSDTVVALGDTMAERLRAAGARDVVVIHNWSNGDLVRPRPTDGHPLRARWGWEGRFVVLYSGNMGLSHEFETVLGAAEMLRDHPRILFAFVGGGPRRLEVEAAVRARGLPNVEFRPYVPQAELGEGLTAGDLHLVTLLDRMPGLLVPCKIYGILAAGRPTVFVGPGRGEVPEILGHGACGTVLALGEEAGLCEAILAYERDPARREREGTRARSLFEQRFSRDHGVAAFRGLIEGSRVAASGPQDPD